MKNQIKPQVHKCTCRVCSEQYIGNGTLCAAHQTQVATQQANVIAQANAVLDAHIAAVRAERQARGRTEWVEVV